MKQSRKGNQWHLGMKLPIGVGDQSGLVHGMEITSANVHDLSPSEKLLHGEEAYVGGMQAIKALRNEKSTRIEK